MDRDHISLQPHTLSQGRRLRQLRGMLAILLLLGLAGGVFAAFLWPAIHAAREAASR